MSAFLPEWNEWLFAALQSARWAPMEPALELVSALGSFAAALYYTRILGAAALRTWRGVNRGPIRGFRLDEHWTADFFVFNGAALLAAVAVAALAPWVQISGHGAFTAVLIATLWPHATDRAARASLLVLLLMLGAARIILGDSPGAMIEGFALGALSVYGARRMAALLSARQHA